MSEELYGFCTNSRRWLIFLTSWTPTTCLYGGGNRTSMCGGGCGYYEERKLTQYARKRLAILTQRAEAAK